MDNLQVTIDYDSLDRSKKIFALIRKQILEDHIVVEGFHMRTEDADIATTVAMLTEAYKIAKKKK